MQDIMETS